MLVIISDNVVTNERRKGDRDEITKHAGIFELSIRVTMKGTKETYKSKRWVADLTDGKVLEILSERPDMSLRIDSLVETQWHDCSRPGKFYHFE